MFRSPDVERFKICKCNSDEFIKMENAFTWLSPLVIILVSQEFATLPSTTS